MKTYIKLYLLFNISIGLFGMVLLVFLSMIGREIGTWLLQAIEGFLP